MATWYTVEEAREDWTLATTNTDQLQLLLDTARDEIEAYAPTVEDPEDIPNGYRWAHLAHAKNIWNASNVDPAGGFGADETTFVYTPHPIDWSIKQRLRPRVIFGGVVG